MRLKLSAILSRKILKRPSDNQTLGFIAILGMLVLSLGLAHGFEITLQWDPNTEANLAGYKIHYGTASGQYDHVVNIGKSVTATVSGLDANMRYYFAVTAFDTSQNESGYSNEVSHIIADIDADGLPDAWEHKYSLNVGVDDASADADRDGFSNSQEFAAGSDPTDIGSCPGGMSVAVLQMLLTILGD